MSTRIRPGSKVCLCEHMSQGIADLSFGLNIKLDGSLHAVTEAHALDYQQIPRKACEVSGLWIATYGIEDARIFWTVSGPGCSGGQRAPGALIVNALELADHLLHDRAPILLHPCHR